MKSKQQLKIKVVENECEKMKTFLVRAIVYMHEQKCPYSEEFDLNDFTATQIIGQIDDEPILTARIRYFGDYAKFERLAVREEYRRKGYGHQLLQFMMRFARSKGYKKARLHAQVRLCPFYESYGFVPLNESFNFSEYDYQEMELDLKGNDIFSNKQMNPLIVNRPENDPYRPGPLEKIYDYRFLQEVGK